MRTAKWSAQRTSVYAMSITCGSIPWMKQQRNGIGGLPVEAKDLSALLKTAVRHVYSRYPDVEWDDLESQAWLIVSESIGSYDRAKGTTLGTYLYGRITYGLQDYVRRSVLKEYNMNGLRDHSDYLEAETRGFAEGAEARMDLASLISRTSGVARDILQLMSKGYNQQEVAEELKVSRQYINTMLKQIRKKFKDT